MTLEEDYLKYQESIEEKKSSPLSGINRTAIFIILSMGFIIIYLTNMNKFFYLLILALGVYLLSKSDRGNISYISENEARAIMLKQLIDYETIRRDHDLDLPHGENIRFGKAIRIPNEWADYQSKRYEFWEIGFSILGDKSGVWEHFAMLIDAPRPSDGCVGVLKLDEEFNPKLKIPFTKIKVVFQPMKAYAERMGGGSGDEE